MTELPALASVSGPSLPALIAAAGERASWRFLEFFTVNIRNKNTRAAYTVAASAFLRWCEEKGMTELAEVKPVHVAAYIEGLQATMKAPSVKQPPRLHPYAVQVARYRPNRAVQPGVGSARASSLGKERIDHRNVIGGYDRFPCKH